MREMVPGDVPCAAALATRVLSDSLVVQLGEGFLRAFYGAALALAPTIALTVVDGDRPVGFALATADVHAFNRQVRKRVLIPLLRALVSPKRLGLAPRFVRGLFDAEPEPPIAAELLLLFVEPSAQGTGVGTALVERLNERLRSLGAERYRVAVRTRLVAAHTFYRSTGFALEQQLLVLGEPMTYYTRTL
jgi:GNAT superfamily N-acetyltransferase